MNTGVRYALILTCLFFPATLSLLGHIVIPSQPTYLHLRTSYRYRSSFCGGTTAGMGMEEEIRRPGSEVDYYRREKFLEELLCCSNSNSIFNSKFQIDWNYQFRNSIYSRYTLSYDTRCQYKYHLFETYILLVILPTYLNIPNSFISTHVKKYNRI